MTHANLRQRFHCRRFCWIALLSAVVVAIALPLQAFAHPLGNFTVNRYSRITAAADGLQLLHIIDMAEIPAHQERTTIDRNHDGEISAEENQYYLDHLTAMLATALQLTVNGQQETWQLMTTELSYPTGQAGLPTLRVITEWQADVAAPQVWSVEYNDQSFAERLGWQEVVVQAGEQTKLLESTAPVTDLTNQLTAYPEDLLQSPLAMHQATFQVQPLAVGPVEQISSSTGEREESQPSIQTLAARSGFASDPFAELINTTILSPFAILLALLAAFGWGAAHAFSPGHGKTVVAAYLVGSRGTVAHALFLGVTTTVTHTAGVFALGLLTLFASQYILAETLYPWLSVLSGLLVAAIGISMVRERWFRPVVHAHNHDGGQSHTHDHTHDHHHDHDHDHSHSHFVHHHHRHGNHHHDDHSHDHHSHSHMPPGGDGTPVTWRSLLALGVSGGLLPCPSALVLMLGAISLNRIGFGLALIILFSLGLASVLTAIGVTLVYAGKYFERIPESGRLFRLLPVASAIFITAIGLGITVQALLNTGTLRLI